MVDEKRTNVIMSEPPTMEKPKPLGEPSGLVDDMTVYFVPSAGYGTRGLGETLRLSLVDFSEKIAQSMDRFGEKYKWELEIDGEVKIYGVFTGTAKLKISPKTIS